MSQEPGPYNTQIIDVYGSNLFHKALTLILIDALLEQNPEHFQQHCRRYAQEAANDATSTMAEQIPKDWHVDPKYAGLPKDAGVTMANGIEHAKQKFLKRFAVQ